MSLRVLCCFRSCACRVHNLVFNQAFYLVRFLFRTQSGDVRFLYLSHVDVLCALVRSISVRGALKVKFDTARGELRVEGPKATNDTFEELLLCLRSNLSCFDMVSPRERKML